MNPDIKVYEGDMLKPSKTVDPAVMQFVMQAAATANLVKMRKLQESTIPIGEKTTTCFVTSQIYELKLITPWISFSLRNDGPGVIFMSVNSEAGLLDRVPINFGETVNEDMIYPVIKSLYMQTSVVGTTANVRIRAKEGA